MKKFKDFTIKEESWLFADAADISFLKHAKIDRNWAKLSRDSYGLPWYIDNMPTLSHLIVQKLSPKEKHSKFSAQISTKYGKTKHIGVYDSFEDAKSAVVNHYAEHLKNKTHVFEEFDISNNNLENFSVNELQDFVLSEEFEKISEDEQNFLINYLSEDDFDLDNLSEAKLGPGETLSFRDQVDQNKIHREGKGKKLTSDLYDKIHKKMASKGYAEVTSKEAALRDNKMSIHTRKHSYHIAPFGNYLHIRKEDDRNNVSHKYHKIHESELDEISDTLKASYKEKSSAQVKELTPWTKKGEYKDLAKNLIAKRKKGLELAKNESEDDISEAVDSVKRNFKRSW